MTERRRRIGAGVSTGLQIQLVCLGRIGRFDSYTPPPDFWARNCSLEMWSGLDYDVLEKKIAPIIDGLWRPIVVPLLETQPTMGGPTAQLNKTYPTPDEMNGAFGVCWAADCQPIAEWAPPRVTFS